MAKFDIAIINPDILDKLTEKQKEQLKKLSKTKR